jgi:aspartyl-tRNA(Asn)/glutamyl-tRNA(Gln) amidotransferase subunit A
MPSHEPDPENEIAFMSALELKAAYERRELSPVDVTEELLERIEERDGPVGAFVLRSDEVARDQAKRAELAYREGRPRALEGVPVSIKDLAPTRGIRTMRGSRLYENWVPDFDAPVVERLRDAGSVFLGKTNTPEFGWKGDSGSRVGPPTRNPFDLSRTAGGSSGGAAAAVATGLGPLAQGGDGGGSIRIPASFCGVFGLKPTFGTVPAYPASAVEQLNHMGPLSRTVRDAALFLDVTAGTDVRDRTSFPKRVESFVAACEGDVRGLRIAWSEGLSGGSPEPDVRDIALAAARVFEDFGCVVEEADPDLPDVNKPIGDLFCGGYAGMLAAGWDEVKDELDQGLRAAVEHGMTLSGAEVAAAHMARLDVYDRMRRFFERYDLLLCPTVSVPPFTAGDDHPETINGVPQESYSWLWFTATFNLSGNPAATVPAGLNEAGLPIGLQIVGPLHADALVMRAAACFEAARPWVGHLRAAGMALDGALARSAA